MLKISAGLTLPLDAVTGTFAILAIRGVGKTHTASVMAEEMLAAGQPIVAYDPTGAWWGLKSSADGKRPGFPVVVFGGEHADVPLEESAGETIAQTIVEKRISAILDCGLMRKGARIRLMTEFCEALYRLNREPLHLFIDEAHTVAPQRAMPDAARLLGAVEDIVLQGRRRGLGLTIISQRPALVNTNVRSQCGTLVAMRIIGPHDRKAITDWTEAHGTERQTKEMLATLASLPKGDAWVWSPVDDIFKRVHFRDRKTFDSSATPTVGGKPLKPQRMAEVDLAALGEAIRATVERVKAEDPRELKKKIAALEKELAKQTSTPSAPAEPTIVKVATPIFHTDDRDLLRGVLSKLASLADELKQFEKSVDERWKQFSTSFPTRGAKATPKPSAPLTPKAISPAAPTRSPVLGDPGNGSLSKCERSLLAVLAKFPAGRDRKQLAILSGYSAGSGGVSGALASLRANGSIDGVGTGMLRITDRGLKLLGDFEPLPQGEALRAYWLDKLTKAESALLAVLIDLYPNGISRDALAAECGYSPGSGGVSGALASLRTLELIEGGGGELRASRILFE